MSTILPQLIVNGLIAGSMYALVASGFSLVYYVLKFMNFAHGAVLTISAYLFNFFSHVPLRTLSCSFSTQASPHPNSQSYQR